MVDRGFVTYSNEAKQQMLGVTPATIDVYGAVSRECAEDMAKGALAHAPVDLAVSITGIAGPTGAVAGQANRSGLFCAASRSGRVIAHDRKYGDIGRKKVPRIDLLQALSMLPELADKKSRGHRPDKAEPKMRMPAGRRAIQSVPKRGQLFRVQRGNQNLVLPDRCPGLRGREAPGSTMPAKLPFKPSATVPRGSRSASARPRGALSP